MWLPVAQAVQSTLRVFGVSWQAKVRDDVRPSCILSDWRNRHRSFGGRNATVNLGNARILVRPFVEKSRRFSDRYLPNVGDEAERIATLIVRRKVRPNASTRARHPHFETLPDLQSFRVELRATYSDPLHWPSGGSQVRNEEKFASCGAIELVPVLAAERLG